MLKDLYAAPDDDEPAGFYTRDLIRFFVVDIIFILAAKLMVGLGAVTRPDTHVMVILGGKLVLLCYLIWLIRDRRDAVRETGIATAGRWWGWPASLGIYALAYPAILGVERVNRFLMERLYPLFGSEYVPAPQDVMILIFEDILATPVRVTLVLFVVLIGPIMEELAFRGIGIDAYKRHSGTVMAVVYTSLLFGLYHFSPNLILPLSVLGAVFALARTVSGSLWCSIFVHTLHNALTLLIMAQELGILETFMQMRGE